LASENRRSARELRRHSRRLLRGCHGRPRSEAAAVPAHQDEGATHTNYLGELYDGRAEEVLAAVRAREVLGAGSDGT
jgi:hypothetical protein